MNSDSQRSENPYAPPQTEGMLYDGLPEKEPGPVGIVATLILMLMYAFAAFLMLWFIWLMDIDFGRTTASGDFTVWYGLLGYAYHHRQNGIEESGINSIGLILSLIVSAVIIGIAARDICKKWRQLASACEWYKT